jgi:hypothetical protein
VRGVEPLVQGLRRHHGLRVQLPQHVTEPASGYCRVLKHCGRHQRKKILPGHFAARPLDTSTLPGAGLSALCGTGEGEFLFDFLRNLLTLAVQRHEDGPSREVMRPRHIVREVLMIAKSSDISALHGFSLVSLMHMGVVPWVSLNTR